MREGEENSRMPKIRPSYSLDDRISIIHALIFITIEDYVFPQWFKYKHRLTRQVENWGRPNERRARDFLYSKSFEECCDAVGYDAGEMRRAVERKKLILSRKSYAHK